MIFELNKVVVLQVYSDGCGGQGKMEATLESGLRQPVNQTLQDQ